MCIAREAVGQGESPAVVAGRGAEADWGVGEPAEGTAAPGLRPELRLGPAVRGGGPSAWQPQEPARSHEWMYVENTQIFIAFSCMVATVPRSVLPAGLGEAKKRLRTELCRGVEVGRQEVVLLLPSLVASRAVLLRLPAEVNEWQRLLVSGWLTVR